MRLSLHWHNTKVCRSQGFYVFIRALQTLTIHNKGVVLVRSGPSNVYAEVTCTCTSTDRRAGWSAGRARGSVGERQDGVFRESAGFHARRAVPLAQSASCWCPSYGVADHCWFGAGCAILSMDNYNDASRVIDGNFDGAPPSVFCADACGA